MAGFSKFKGNTEALGSRAQLLVLPVLAFIAIGVIVLAILAIIVMPTASNGRQRGVGADGFRAFKEQGTNLGIGDVVSKDQVVAALGDKALKVKDVSVSDVFNLNGNRGQTATFDFIRADGANASVYVDVMMFKNTATMEEANILAATANAGKINGYPAYFMHALTLGYNREYRLLVVNGLKAYKFVMTQPAMNITINEVAAIASLKRLALKANL